MPGDDKKNSTSQDALWRGHQARRPPRRGTRPLLTPSTLPAEGHMHWQLKASQRSSTSTRYSCFTGTKVQILAQPPHLGAQFACFTVTKVQILTAFGVRAAVVRVRKVLEERMASASSKTQVFTTEFNGFTSTKVQILTQKAALPDESKKFTCFTSTKVQIMTVTR